MATVAVVGLGAMGARMARRLLDSHHELVVWNRDPAKLEPLTDLGANRAASPAEAARVATVVITMVSGPQALSEVTEGAEGVAAGATAATTVVQMSTVGPASVSRLESVLPRDVGLLDAPVLGSVSEAESGSLKIFAGGAAALVERWTPLLSALGSVLHVGPLGAGTAAKLVANATLLGVLGVLGEALALAQALELERAVAFEVLSATPLEAQAKRRRRSIETGRYPPRFSLSLARKDADLILDAAASSGADLRLAAAARAWLAEAEEAGWGDRDYSAVLARILRAAK
jgi:3-hydroxyisobutyrate dehydrogenase-like beta-hydroxyacid dehydrogenase